MNREEYKAAFDSIPFSPDFQARTQTLLRDRLLESEKETQKMNFSKPKKLAVLLAAAVALLAVSVSAALFLTPADVAARLEDDPLAAAFQSGDKGSGTDHTALGMDPTNQRFRRYQIAGGSFHNRLIVNLEFPVGNG